MNRCQVGRVLAQHFDGNHCLFAQCAIAILREARYRGHGLADPARIDALADRLHHARDLVSDAGGKLWLLKVPAAHVDGLGPVQARCLHPYPDLALARLLRLSLLKPENFRAAKLMKPNDFGHVVSFMPLDGRKKEEDAG